MRVSRRNVLVGIVGFGVGGALATATGLGTYYYRRRRRGQTANQSVVGEGLDDWMLTEDDLNVIADLNGLPQSESLDIIDNTDIIGSGDFREARVDNVEQCVSLCEEDTECNAFTFARLSHPTKDKRHMCWLKGDRKPDNLTSDVFYISGVRK